MNSFIKKCLQFICFAALFYAASLVIWERYLPDSMTPNINYRIGSYGHLNTRIKEIPTYQNVDILILGSSHAYRGFDTRIFSKNGLSAFNLGSSAQTPIQTKILLSRYLEDLNPKLILYEVYPGTFTSDGVESALDLIANDQNDLLSIQMALRTNNIKVYNTLIYGFIRDLFSLNSNFVENRIKGPDTYIDGGYVEKKLSYNKENLNYSPVVWNLNAYQLAAFEDILAYLEEKGITVILVQAPFTSLRSSQYMNNQEVDEYFQGLGKYYNFNELLDLSDHDHFYDSHHLNQSGVEIFNRELLETLSTDGFLDFSEK